MAPIGRLHVIADERVGAQCLVNDRADIALAVGADGVHVGDDDLPPRAPRSAVFDADDPARATKDPAAAIEEVSP